MQRLTQSFALLSPHVLTQNVCLRGISNKNLLEKLGLPEKPKRPLTPYFAFAASVRSELTRKNPNAKVSELSQLIGKLWAQISDNEKKKYSDEFHKEYQKYKVDLERYEKSLTVEQRTEIREAEEDIKVLKEQRLIKLVKQRREKELNKPKAPLPPYFRFAKDNNKGNDSWTEHIKKMAEKWAMVPDNLKEKYRNEYEKERTQYLKELEQWEEEMIKQGHIDVVRTKTLKQKYKINSK